MSTPIADPSACGTCRRLAAAGKPLDHEQCTACARLLPAPDQPCYETLLDLTDEQRRALPARFHTPHFDDLGKPTMWLCRVCWGDGWVTQWPCKAAFQHGTEVFTPEHHVERQAATGPDTWATIRNLSAWLQRENGTGDHQTAMRLMKLTEEVGEVMQAYSGSIGQNPRKGITHTSADVAEELVDVMVTAAVALCEFADDPGAVFAEKLGRIAARAGVAGGAS